LERGKDRKGKRKELIGRSYRNSERLKKPPGKRARDAEVHMGKRAVGMNLGSRATQGTA